MGFMHGNDGQVSWSTLGNIASRAIAWTCRDRVAVVDVGTFVADNEEDLEPGRHTREGTITCRSHSADTPVPAGGIAVLTLKTAISAPYWILSGSAMLTEVPLARTRGDQTDDVVYAFRGIGSWMISSVPS